VLRASAAISHSHRRPNPINRPHRSHYRASHAAAPPIPRRSASSKRLFASASRCEKPYLFFYPHFAIPSALRAAGASRYPAPKERECRVRSRDDGGPEPRPARSTPGEPGRAADRQAFASLSCPTDRQVLHNPHVGRPGFLVSMSIHTAPPFRLGGVRACFSHRDVKDHPHYPDILSFSTSRMSKFCELRRN